MRGRQRRDCDPRGYGEAYWPILTSRYAPDAANTLVCPLCRGWPTLARPVAVHRRVFVRSLQMSDRDAQIQILRREGTRLGLSPGVVESVVFDTTLGSLPNNAARRHSIYAALARKLGVVCRRGIP
jgi:hypothetical protein